MKNIVMIILAALLLAGCSKQIQGTPTNQYNQYLVDFNQDLVRLGYSKIDFSQTIILESLLDDKKEGNCASGLIKRNSGVVYIQVIKGFTESPAFYKKLLIYHEVGHCFFGLNHKDGISIMNRNVSRGVLSQSDFIDENKRLFLIKEMIEDASYK